MSQTIQTMLHEWLKTLHFDQMATDALSETEMSRLRRYARVILRDLPPSEARKVSARFAVLGLL